MQKLIGVFAVTSKANSACLQSSTAAERLHRVLDMSAVHQWWVVAGLYEMQKLIGVYTVTSKAVFSLLAEQHCCKALAQSP